MDYATIKQFVDMPRLLDHFGIQPNKGRCACPLHGGNNKTAFSVHNDEQGWTCHTKCGTSGDIFTFIEKHESVNNSEARLRIMEIFNLSDGNETSSGRLGASGRAKQDASKVEARVEGKKRKAKAVGRTEYIYRDRDGKELFKVKRVDYADGRKDCFQECQGKPTLPPEVRTLYNLDRIHGNAGDYVCLCEGEKTADALTMCGYIGTTNPLGSKNWNAEYAELLRGQKVIVMPDADEHGEKWRDEVLVSLQGSVEQVQVVNMPDSFIKEYPKFKGHDFADYLQVHGKDAATLFMIDAVTETPVLRHGVEPELLGRPDDDWSVIVSRAKAGISTVIFDLGEWLPSLPLKVRKGDLLTLMANTSVGKTRLLHNIPFHIRRLNYAIFDLELSRETLAIRYAAMANRCSVDSIEQALDQGKRLKPPSIENVYIQKESALTVEKIAERVELIETVTGRQMHVVAVDYIGLMTGQGSSYESTTSNVEAFKAYVSAAGKVGILTTQVSRPENKERGLFECPSPFSAKNSGSIENSSQILLGFWRDKKCHQTLWARCLKYTHGTCPERDLLLVADNLLIEESTRTSPVIQ